MFDKRQWEAEIIPDKYKHERGPYDVPKRWLEDLNRIDPRLVLRWQPNWRRYAVFSKFNEDRIWSQPTHIVENPATNTWRKPDDRDLVAIRYAKHVWEAEGQQAYERMLDEQVKRDSDFRESNTRSAAQGIAKSLCQKFDLTKRKLLSMLPDM